jgi:hypothetical protein
MGRNAPAEAGGVFADIPTPPNVYVTNPQATGWGDTWNGAPVVRPPLYADEIWQNGERVPSVAAIQGIVYSNSVSALTIYTNASGAATSWWQVASGVTNSGTFASGTPGAITNGQSRVSFGAVEVPGRPNFNPSDSALSIFAPAKFIYVDSDVGGEWGIKFRGTGGEGFVDIFGFTADGATGEIKFGSRWPTYYLSLMSGGETRVSVKKDGKVGIGTEYPSEILHVSGNCISTGTNTAAEVRSTGGYIIGPTISGKQAHIFTDGTNCFFVNVNSVTNGGSVPYADWTGTVTPQNGTATVAYAHGNMPVLVVPDGGGTTYVTVATGTYVATSGVSRVSLSIWAGTNAIELVTNEVDYVSAPDIPTNGWGTILFRRVSNGKWKGVGL